MSVVRRPGTGRSCSSASNRAATSRCLVAPADRDRRAVSETLDQGVGQLLLQPMRGLEIRKHVRPSFVSANRRLIQVTQFPESGAWRAPSYRQGPSVLTCSRRPTRADLGRDGYAAGRGVSPLDRVSGWRVCENSSP